MIGQTNKYRAIIAPLPALLLSLVALCVPDPYTDQLVTTDRFLLEGQHQPESIEEVFGLPDQAWRSVGRAPVVTRIGDKDTRWWRLDVPRVTSDPKSDAEFVVDLRSMFPRQLAFYLVESHKVVNQFVSGWEHAEGLGRYPGMTYYFPFVASDQPRQIYIKTVAEAHFASFPKMHVAKDFYQMSQRRDFIFSLLHGCLIGIALYSLMLWYVLRQRVFAYQSLVQWAIVPVSFYLSDYGRAIVPGLVLSHDAAFLIAASAQYLMLIFLMLFISDYFKMNRNFPKMIKVNRWMLLITGAGWLALPFVSLGVGLIIVLLVSLIVMMRNLLIYRRYLHHKFVFFLAMGTAGYISGFLVLMSAAFNLITHSLFVETSYHLSAIWLGSILSISMTFRLKSVESRHEKIMGALKGGVQLTKLNSLIGNPYAGQFNTSELHVTLMFVDIAGFSQMSRGHSDREMFGVMSSLLAEIIVIIEEYGGAIDRSLGSGLLCLFGYKKIGRPTEHAITAFQAACKIQEMTVGLSTDSSQQMKMPVCIGIHSSPVMIGNIGDEAHIDFTMIGSGVNFASRLKEACSPYKILVSQNTIDYLSSAGVDRSRFVPISIAIKHQDRLFDAYEYNPFADSLDRLIHAEKAFLDQLGLRSTDRRYRMKVGAAVQFQTPHGAYVVNDFSRYGFNMIGPSLLGRQSVVPVLMATTDVSVNNVLADALLAQFMVEVRWSKQTVRGYEHGVRLFGGNNRQGEFIFEIMKQNFGLDSDVEVPDGIVNQVA